MCPGAASMPMPAGTSFSLPFTITTSVVCVCVATPSAVSNGTRASLVLRTSSAEAGVPEPPGEDDPPLMPLMTAIATTVASTAPATIHATGIRGLAAGATGGRGAGRDLDGDGCFPPAARAFDAGGDLGLGLGLTVLLEGREHETASLTAACLVLGAGLSGSHR